MGGLKSPGSSRRYHRVGSFLFFAFIIAVTLGSGSLKGDRGDMEVTGKIAVVGNEPFSQVVVRSEDGQVYALVGTQDKELRRLQGRRVAITGKASEEKPRGTRAIEVKSFRVLED